MNEYFSVPCTQWQEKLAVLPPDALSSVEQEELENHISSCDACNSARQQYRVLSAALQTISTDTPPLGLPPRLLQQWQETDKSNFSIPFFHNRRPLSSANQRRSFPISLKKRSYAVGIFAVILLIGIILSTWIVTQISPNSGKSRTDSTPYLGPTAFAFPASMSYNQALMLVTDMGVQPSLKCFTGARLTPGSEITPWPQWQPVGQKEAFLKNHQLLLDPTFSAPSDWRLKLQAVPGVRIEPYKTLTCQNIVYGTPPPGVAVPLTSAQSGTYARITFTSPLQTYDVALYSVSDIGLGLTNICYEQAKAAGNPPPWQPIGEEQLFTKTHTLVVKTQSLVTSSLWQTQLRAQAGVITIQILSSPNCANATK